MTHKTVYYADVYQNGSSNPIIKQNELIDKSYVYTTCPVFNHYSNRTFVVSSPIDFSFSIKRTINSTNNELISDINIDNLDYKDLLFDLYRKKFSLVPLKEIRPLLFH